MSGAPYLCPVDMARTHTISIFHIASVGALLLSLTLCVSVAGELGGDRARLRSRSLPESFVPRNAHILSEAIYKASASPIVHGQIGFTPDCRSTDRHRQQIDDRAF